MTWRIVTWAATWALVGVTGTAVALMVAVTGSRPSAVEIEERAGLPDALRNRMQEARRLLKRANASGALPVAAGWSFKDSWAANLTGLITVFAAIGAAFGAPLKGVLSEVAAAQLGVVCAFGTATTALGPMLYSTFQTWKSDAHGLPAAGGTAWGLLAAATATLLGLFGSIGALGWVGASRQPHVGGIAFCMALLLVSALVAAYSVRTLKVLLSWAATSPDPTALYAARPSILVGIVTRRCCGDEQTSVVVNLL